MAHRQPPVPKGGVFGSSVFHVRYYIFPIGLAPLCENMPSGKANKPGDVVRARNGKTIQVDNTDAEGRLILADALCYAHTFNPKVIINAATLTGAMDVALGSGATGVFTNSSWLWNKLFEVGLKHTPTSYSDDNFGGP